MRTGLKLEEFLANETLRRAAVRSLEIIGEAAKKVPEEFRKNYPAIEWRAMSGMRDRLNHDPAQLLVVVQNGCCQILHNGAAFRAEFIQIPV